MSTSLLAHAFEHHVWATVRVIDACRELGPEQLATTVPGTYGSILDTLRHLVEADANYLAVLSGERSPRIEDEALDLPALRAAMERNGAAWTSLLDEDLDPDRVVVRHRDDGSEFHAPLGLRIAQVLHHGTDHRSQICTVLTTLGIEPPLIDVWDFGEANGRVVETPATS